MFPLSLEQQHGTIGIVGIWIESHSCGDDIMPSCHVRDRLRALNVPNLIQKDNLSL
jgi:hypothetical protein